MPLSVDHRFPEPESIAAFKTWLTAHGACFHDHVRFVTNLSGYRIVAIEPLGPDTTIVTSPFALAITPSLSKNALVTVLRNEEIVRDWSERQLICSYICFHWILDPGRNHALSHAPYLNTLPPPEQLRTPLHFTPTELEALKGTNLHGATLDRRIEWRKEWSQCQQVIACINTQWAESFTWECYLTAATYLSSRAFPSTLLAPTPSLVATSTSYPVLLPGVDALNHARAQPVSWVVSFPPPSASTNPSQEPTDPSMSTLTSSSVNEPTVSLVHHAPVPALSEIFNNYGPKPNAELILGYGFSLPDNPDDTIVLRIGSTGGDGKRWEVGRDAKGAEGVWDELLQVIRACEDEEQDEIPGWSLALDAAAALQSMTSSLIERLPSPHPAGVRSDVAPMINHYVVGQREVLEGLLRFAQKREEEAVLAAKREGVNVLVDEEPQGGLIGAAGSRVV
ncbi:hypothetical protein EW146_g4197 [Bondarzewia mesenterica]|uniref:SET domain-containing protein n=1 Tax=Bondarzewia mesenterica TaxID=1095465 RepID=A0A4S4LXF8_9AGAM|nr:hypothetical protein EW146_g4197 [Bondarzewia mesenterica]